MSDLKPWFQPKSYGYGAGLPISWEGWVALAIYLIVVIGGANVSRLFFSGGVRIAVLLAVVIIPTAILIPIAKARTEGGWRWRSGSD